jgi:hypothetical protein
MHLSFARVLYRQVWLVMALTLAAPCALVIANHALHGHCERCGCACEHTHLVACKVKVPMQVTETRVKTCVIQKMKESEETCTVFKRVPVKRQITKERCYLADEVKTQMITEKGCQIVQNPVVSEYQVDVPETECREGTRTRVCHHCGKTYCIEEPCTCMVTTTHKEPRSCTYCEPQLVITEKKREIAYCVKVPKKETEVCAEETVYKLEPVQQTRKVQICVPELVKQPVEVCVTKMVEKTIYCCQKCCH